MRESRDQRAARRPRRPAGFSLVELLVGLAVTSMLLLAIVGVFDAGSKVARVETQVSDLQQSLRASHRQMTRIINMAGRGGLPLTLPGVPPYQGPALTLRNAAGDGGSSRDIAVGFDESPKAIKNSDILIARGVFNTPIYQVNTLAPGDFTLLDEGDTTNDPTAATDGVVMVRGMTNTGLPQDLTPLIEAIDDGIPEALVLLSPMDERIVAVVELDTANSNTGTPGQVAVAFKVRGMSHSDYRDLYVSGGGAEPVLPIGLNTASHVGILEEYRFYVREAETPIPGLPRAAPKLSMARMFPGTEIPYLSALPNAGVDLADNVLDMQVGLAFDSDEGPAWTDQNNDTEVDVDDKEIYESPNGENDDFLFNTPEDDPSESPWDGSAAPQPRLYFVRLSLLARTARRERNYQAPQLLGYEDVDPLRVLAWNQFDQRLYRRAFQQTVIDLRNF